MEIYIWVLSFLLLSPAEKNFAWPRALRPPHIYCEAETHNYFFTFAYLQNSENFFFFFSHLVVLVDDAKDWEQL